MGNDLGLALSGGGSRAMAFHRGTVRALCELGVVDSIDVLSTVSGGSIFAAAWLCARADRQDTPAFLDRLEAVLARGFIRPALLSPRIFELLLPGRNRTHRLAQTFDEIFTGGRRLADLPARPLLVLNTSVLNHAATGRFSQGGFSCRSVGPLEESGSYPETPLDVTVGFAAAASAAFPFGLPPLPLPVRGLPDLTEPIQGQRKLLLTDGGVLENLGAERLLRSGRFRAHDLIVSDAGTADGAWQPSFLGRLKNFFVFALSRDTLERLLNVMNGKENKSMRQITVHEVGAVDPPEPDRLLWFARVDQSWNRFVRAIPQARRRAIAGPSRAVPGPGATAAEVEKFLLDHGVCLDDARSRYEEMGGDAAVKRANGVGTGLRGLPRDIIQLLERHAAWQVHACRRIYGAIGLDRRRAPVARSGMAAVIEWTASP
jgi:NTE family protein